MQVRCNSAGVLHTVPSAGLRPLRCLVWSACAITRLQLTVQGYSASIGTGQHSTVLRMQELCPESSATRQE